MPISRGFKHPSFSRDVVHLLGYSALWDLDSPSLACGPPLRETHLEGMGAWALPAQGMGKTSPGGGVPLLYMVMSEKDGVPSHCVPLL